MTSRPPLLAVLAHPDDESLGVSGTLAKYAASGVDVCLLTATRGEGGRFRGHPAGTRSIRVRWLSDASGRRSCGLPPPSWACVRCRCSVIPDQHLDETDSRRPAP